MRAHLSDRGCRGALCFLFSLVLTLGLPTLVCAQSYLPKLGGPGGGSFEETCPPGTNLQGFLLGTADDVDSIQIYCIYPTRAGQSPRTGAGLPSLLDGLLKSGSVARNLNILVGKSHGGVRGTPRGLVCPWEMPVLLGISVESEGAETVIVNSIALYCGQAAASEVVFGLPNAIFEGPRYNRAGPWLGIGVGGTPSFPDTQFQKCPVGQVAIGLHGRSGLWVDAIGLICGAPRLAAAAPPNVVGSIGKRPTTGPSQPRSGSICDSARDARARNSPAAPNLEAQCNAQKTPVSSIGRRGGAAIPAGAPRPICESAADARARNSPAAPNLEAQCAAYLATRPPAGEAPPPDNPPADPPPDADPPGN